MLKCLICTNIFSSALFETFGLWQKNVEKIRAICDQHAMDTHKIKVALKRKITYSKYSQKLVLIFFVPKSLFCKLYCWLSFVWCKIKDFISSVSLNFYIQSFLKSNFWATVVVHCLTTELTISIKKNRDILLFVQLLLMHMHLSLDPSIEHAVRGKFRYMYVLQMI